MVVLKPLKRYTQIDSGGLMKLFRQPDVYIPSADDHTRPDDVMRFIDNVLAHPAMYVLGRDSRHEAFIFAPSHNATTFQAHVAVRKDFRGGDLVDRIVEAGAWILRKTTCRSIIAFIREENKGIRSILGQLGMKERGRIKRSVLFNGKYQDEIVYQASYEELVHLWGDRLGGIE